MVGSAWGRFLQSLVDVGCMNFGIIFVMPDTPLVQRLLTFLLWYSLKATVRCGIPCDIFCPIGRCSGFCGCWWHPIPPFLGGGVLAYFLSGYRLVLQLLFLRLSCIAAVLHVPWRSVLWILISTRSILFVL